MAIYTQYGRYLKAKLFKQAMNSGGGVYMAFGIGNPDWDTNTELPNAPYAESAILDSESPWYDDTTNFRMYRKDNITPLWTYSNNDYDNPNRVPLFPVVSRKPFNPTIEFQRKDQASSVAYYSTQQYVKYSSSDDEYLIVSNIGGFEIPILPPDRTDTRTMSIFTDLYLRGRSLELSNFSGDGNMLGLLGMVKGDVQLVKDIGSESTGALNEFYYGDRYWKVINSVSEEDTELPCHVLISAGIEPFQLTDHLETDLGTVARQIAIFHKKTLDSNPTNSYKVSEYLFNFGQIREPSPTVSPEKILDLRDNPDAEFEFLLNDYIKGASRVLNQIDRYGYIVGF